MIHARWYTRTDGRQIDLVVVHTMEAPEKGETAEACARYLSRLPATRKASVHFCVDADEEIRCLPDRHVAYAAPGANHNGLHIEHAGYARQTPAEWADAYSERMLRRSARLTASLCKRYGIPVRFVGPAGLKAGRRGVTTHAAVTKAFPGPARTHWDPGPGFPIRHYLELVRAQLKKET
jgi:N-acetylmuramoyl-L-alanine amidase CwlA